MTNPPGPKKAPTNIVKMREALRQSEELHRIILTNISDSVFLTDDNGRFTYICPNVDNIFGYSFEEIYGMGHISALIGKDAYDTGRLRHVPEIRNIERVVRDKNGTSHTVLINVKKVRISYGTRLFTCRDITEYKRVKEELSKNIRSRKRMEKDLSFFFNLSADLFAIADRNRLMKVNPAWTAALGYPPRHFAGRPISDLVHPDDLDNTLSLERRLRPGDVVRYENRYRHKDGTYRWMSWNSTMSDDWHVITVGRDMTVKKREEDEMKRRLLKFKLQNGRTYLVQELSPVKLVEAFRELLDLHFPGVVVSRREEEFFSGGLEKGFKYMWFSDRTSDRTMKPDPARIEAYIEGLSPGHVVVVDSLEFLMRRCGFPAVLSFVCHLREIAFFKNHIVLIGVDGSCISDRESRLLGKEAQQIERHQGPALPEENMQILRRVYEDNSNGVRPTRTQLCQSLDLSHPTLRKRLAELKAGELLWETRVGRSVIVEITQKGRSALES